MGGSNSAADVAGSPGAWRGAMGDASCRLRRPRLASNRGYPVACHGSVSRAHGGGMSVGPVSRQATRRAERNGLPKAARIVTVAAGPSALRLDVTTLRTTRLGRGRALAVICLLQFALRLRHDRLNESDFGCCSPEAFSVGFRFAREKSAAESASLRRPQPRRRSPARPL